MSKTVMTDQSLPEDYWIGRIICLREEGRYVREIAGLVGKPTWLVRRIIRDHRPDLLKIKVLSARDSEIVKLRQAKMTYESISKIFGITRERVRQVLKRHSPAVLGFNFTYPPIICKVCGQELNYKGSTYAQACATRLCKRCKPVVHGLSRTSSYLQSRRQLYNDIRKMRECGLTWRDIVLKMYPELLPHQIASKVSSTCQFVHKYNDKISKVLKLEGILNDLRHECKKQDTSST